jgi:hypothetical protein
MTQCNDCGRDFFDEYNPLSTLCRGCSDDRDGYYADWVAEQQLDYDISTMVADELPAAKA